MEKEINASYTEMGKIYYRKYAQESEDQELLSYIHKIVSSMRKIEELQVQIRSIKGIVKCKNYGVYQLVNFSNSSIRSDYSLKSEKMVAAGSLDETLEELQENLSFLTEAIGIDMEETEIEREEEETQKASSVKSETEMVQAEEAEVISQAS